MQGSINNKQTLNISLALGVYIVCDEDTRSHVCPCVYIFCLTFTSSGESKVDQRESSYNGGVSSTYWYVHRRHGDTALYVHVHTIESGYQAHAPIGIAVKMYALDSEVR